VRVHRPIGVMDAYNAVISRAVDELGGPQHNITFVDTNFIVGPLWDAGSDWCHLDAPVSDVEALYLMAVALGVIQLDDEPHTGSL
jgi:hypothetical protein